jgi:hypothetical protein
VEWIHLAQNRYKELVFVKRVMNLRVPSNVGISWLDEEILASQERISYINK